MRNKVITLTNKKGRKVFLHCARVYETMDRRAVLEMDREKQTDGLWWYMDIADQFDGEYEFRQEDKTVILAVDQEIITAMYNY